MKEYLYYIEYVIDGRLSGTGPYKADVVLSLFNEVLETKGICEPKISFWDYDHYTVSHICSDFEVNGKKYTIGNKYYTDYPFTCLGDIPEKKAPVRLVKLLSFDNNKYCYCSFGKWINEIKLGYFYNKPQRMNSDFDGPNFIDEPIEKVLTPDE